MRTGGICNRTPAARAATAPQSKTKTNNNTGNGVGGLRSGGEKICDVDVKKLDDVLLIGGGIIPKRDIKDLEKLGVGKLYGPGTPVNDTIEYIKDWVLKNR